MTDVSQEYASALFSLSRETGESFLEGLTTVEKVLREDYRYTELLASPGIPLEERLQALDEAIGDAVPKTVCSFVKLLCRQGHIRLYPECVEAYRELDEAERRHSTARVISAVPLTPEEQERLRDRLEKMSGHTVALVCEEDPTILGGAVVYMDGQVLDGSLRRRLHDMKEAIDT